MLNAQPRVAEQRVNSLDLVQHVDAHRQSISFQSTERYDVRIDVGAVTHGYLHAVHVDLATDNVNYWRVQLHMTFFAFVCVNADVVATTKQILSRVIFFESPQTYSPQSAGSATNTFISHSAPLWKAFVAPGSCSAPLNSRLTKSESNCCSSTPTIELMSVWRSNSRSATPRCLSTSAATKWNLRVCDLKLQKRGGGLFSTNHN